MHILPDRWQFDGDLENPTFHPSFRHTGCQLEIVNGKWVEPWWKRDAEGNTIPSCCHYVLTKGILNFCVDCTHSMAGKVVPLPVLPEHLRD